MASRQTTYRLEGPVRLFFGFDYKELIGLTLAGFGGAMSVQDFAKETENPIVGIALQLMVMVVSATVMYFIILGFRYLRDRMPDKYVKHIRAWYILPDVFVPKADPLAKPIEIWFEDDV